MDENTTDLVGKEFIFEYGVDRILPPSDKTGGVFATEQRAYRRERIVRCRDCMHGDPFCECSSYPGKIDCLHFAQWNHYDDEPGVCVMEPDDFCSYGVMRDGD